MPSHKPTIDEATIAQFGRLHDQTKDIAKRDKLERSFVNFIEESSINPTETLRTILQITRATGARDLTRHLSFFQTPTIPLLDTDTVKDAISEAQLGVPWWRRASAATLGALDWWQTEVIEPSAALSLAALFKATPGEQDFERRLTAARQTLSQERSHESKSISFRDNLDLISDAYRDTNLPWGTKGLLELVADPLNLIGLGIPGKLGKSFPLLRPILFPLRAIDRAPEFATKKLLQLPGGLTVGGKKVTPGIQNIPGIKFLAKPHFSTQVREVFGRTYAAVSESFGGGVFADGTPADTIRVLSDMSRWPQNDGPYTLRNIFNHLAEVHGERAWAGKDGTGGILGALKLRSPQEAANDIAQLVAAQESRAIRMGRFSIETGKEVAGGARRISGEIVEKGSRQNRREAFESIFQKLKNDDRWARGLAEGADNWLHRFETFYLRVVEPNVIRPWSLAQLAFAGFLPMNMLEDIGMSMVGLGVSPFGVSDAMWRIKTAGLNTPTHLISAEGQVRNTLDLQLGKFTDAVKPGFMERTALFFGGIFVKKSSEYGWAYRRASWDNLFNKELVKSMRKVGIKDSEVDALKRIVHSDIPKSLAAVSEDIGVMAWQAVTTGDPQAIRNLRQLTTSDRMIQKAQTALFTDTGNLPPAARDIFRKTILKEGGINAGNADEVIRQMNAELAEWHRLATPEGIRASYKDFVQAVGQRPAVTVTDAHAQLTLLQNASDTLADMANEMRRNAKHRADAVHPSLREQIYRESDDLTDKMVDEIRRDFEEATKRTKPKITEILSSSAVVRTSAQSEAVVRSIDDMFEGYKNISENLRKTWKEHLAKRRDLFDQTPKADRDEAFWLVVAELGNEVWEAEAVFRAREANNIRTGWNSLLGVVKFSTISPRSRDVYKAGLQSQIHNAESHYQVLLSQVRSLENTLGALPESQIAPRVERINALKIELRRSVEDVLNLEKELGEFGRVRNAIVPEELRKYDTAIRTLRKQRKKAEEFGFESHIPNIDAQIVELAGEREMRFENFIPLFAKQRWTTLKSRQEGLDAAVRASTTKAESTALARESRKNLREISAFRKQIEKGDAAKTALEFGNVTTDNLNRVAIDLLEQIGGELPATVNKAEELFLALAESGHEVADSILGLIEDGVIKGDEIAERLYTRMAALTDVSSLNEMQTLTLRSLVNNPDALPTSVTTELAERSLINVGPRLKNGRFRFELTDAGREALEVLPQSAIDIDDVVARMPPIQRKFLSTLDALLEDSENAVRKAVDISNNPPMRQADEKTIGRYFDTIANHLEERPELIGQFTAARKEAADITTKQYNDFFVNYDNRSTFDFIMQRFMPFWMYESRRWPRMIRLAGKRPFLAKNMTLVGNDWDYGYTSTPFGFQFNPVKGVLIGALRRTGAREFPELHNGLRGKVEQGLDYLGRGGFYLAPPFTAAFDIAQGEISNTLPPPISLLLHGLVAGIGATGGDIPEELIALTFSSRYTNFLTDQIIADRFNESPNAVRRGVENNDEDSIAMLNLARSEAAARMILLVQASVLRYRPPSKIQFIEDVDEAIELYTGISKDTQKELDRLGIPLYSIITVSGFQRRAIRESIPNYDAWIAANVSLRPVAEQRELLTIDKFWSNVERFQVKFESDMALVNDNWINEKITGPEARARFSDLQSSRAAKFQDIKSDPEFSGVPITIKERQRWSEEHGSVAPLVHPIDEILENYYAITPEKHIDPFTGEPDFGKFFQAREDLLDTYADTGFDEMARQALQRGETDLERSLRNASPWIREYFGIRDQLLRDLEETNPSAIEDFNTYRQLRIMANNAGTTREKSKLNSEARSILRNSPDLPMLERKVRVFRERFRRENPEMELVYQQWISKPQVIPPALKVSRQGTGLGVLRSFDNIRTIESLGFGR